MQKQRPVYEAIVVSLVVVLALVMSATLYAGRAKVQKGGMLMVELETFRNAIQAYRLANGENPPSLVDLAKAKIGDEGEARPYLDPPPALEGGRAIDPYGNPYAYDSKSGWISSSTPGYERW